MATITGNEWTLFDKVMYGGLGYGSFCLPTNFFSLIIAILFPPLGEVITILGDKIDDEFPYFTWDCAKELVKIENINRIIISFVLTTLFYIPGLVYVLGNINDSQMKKPETTKPVTDSEAFDDIENFINRRF